MLSSPFSAALALAVSLASSTVSAIEPCQIQGSRWLSPQPDGAKAQTMGVVTATACSKGSAYSKGSDSSYGFWMRGASGGLDATSDSIYVSGNAACRPETGDGVTVIGVVKRWQ